jgi:uncharacterized protein (DUF433 family)
MNKPFDRITVDPKVMSERPCIRGMRLTVRRVVEAVAQYPDRSELRQEYPELEHLSGMRSWPMPGKLGSLPRRSC